jgi:hypothetical protein
MKRMSGLLMMAAVAGIVVGCGNLDKLKPVIDDAIDSIDKPEPPAPEPVPVPVPEPQPEPPAPAVHPDHVNRMGVVIKVPDGHGTYKPWDYEHPMNPGASKLWLLPARIQPGDIRSVGIYRRDDTFVRFCNWPNGIGPLSGKPIDGSQLTADPSHPFWWRSSAPPKGSGIDHAGRIKARQAKPPEPDMELRCVDVFGAVVARLPIGDPDLRHEGQRK